MRLVSKLLTQTNVGWVSNGVQWSFWSEESDSPLFRVQGTQSGTDIGHPAASVLHTSCTPLPLLAAKLSPEDLSHVSNPVRLGTRYAMSGTDAAYGAICLCIYYAISGTGISHCAICRCVRYGISGADVA
eukprot:1455137-Rhodomonas_salina.3